MEKLAIIVLLLPIVVAFILAWKTEEKAKQERNKGKCGK